MIDSIILDARQFCILNVLDGLWSIGKFLLVDFFDAAHSSRSTVPGSVDLVMILTSARVDALYELVGLIEVFLSALRHLADRVVVSILGIPGHSFLHCFGCELNCTLFKVFDSLILRMHANSFELKSQLSAIPVQLRLLLRSILFVPHSISNLYLIIYPTKFT